MQAVQQRAKRPAKAAQSDRAISFGQLDQRLGYRLRRAQIAVFQTFFEAVAAHDIRPAQYSVLTIIEHNPGLSQTQVAGALGIKTANFVAMIKDLEKRGLVSRQQIKHNRRTHELFITAEGQILIEKLHALTKNAEERIKKHLGVDVYSKLFKPLEALVSLF
jgi:DNA-binding MarR family transcriptional regulator